MEQKIYFWKQRVYQYNDPKVYLQGFLISILEEGYLIQREIIMKSDVDSRPIEAIIIAIKNDETAKIILNFS